MHCRRRAASVDSSASLGEGVVAMADDTSKSVQVDGQVLRLTDKRKAPHEGGASHDP
jgi:hypothetical protein